VIKKILYSTAIILLLLSALGCRQEKAEDFKVELPPTPVLTVRSKWAVVSSSHLRLREKATIQSSAITTLWQNNVLEIISRDETQMVVEDKSGYWYKVAYDGIQGWVFGAYLEMFESENEARRAARESGEN